MSTRCNVVLIDAQTKPDIRHPFILYRHSDGYPEGAQESLDKFLGYVRDERIRDNVGQAGGWLILIGFQEYAKPSYRNDGSPQEHSLPHTAVQDIQPVNNGISGWKVGAYEPTDWGLHGGIEYLYVVDLKTRTWHGRRVPFGASDNGRGDTFLEMFIAEVIEARESGERILPQGYKAELERLEREAAEQAATAE